VHVRKGDYKHWQDGKYFFSDLQYAFFMKLISEIFINNGNKIKFALCSNEPISCDSPMLNYSALISKGTEIEDLCLLSNCDYIIGPPSSFSAWASFIGKVPLLHIENEAQDINLDKFCTYLG
jgi:hypothetical protein